MKLSSFANKLRKWTMFIPMVALVLGLLFSKAAQAGIPFFKDGDGPT